MWSRGLSGICAETQGEGAVGLVVRIQPTSIQPVIMGICPLFLGKVTHLCWDIQLIGIAISSPKGLF